MAATILGNPVTVTTGLAITTLPNVSPVTIISTAANADSFWELSGAKLIPENDNYKVGLAVIDTDTTIDNHFLLYDTAAREIKKIAGSDIALENHTHPWGDITSNTPTTLSGYGITNAYTKTETYSKTETDALYQPIGDYEPLLDVPNQLNLVLTSDLSGHKSWIVQQGTGGTGMAMHGSEYHNTLNNAAFSGSFTLGGTALTTTATKLNYLTNATGSTGTNSTNIVFSTSPTITTPTFATSFGFDSGTSWRFSLNGNDLIISYGGTPKGKLSTTGAFTVINEVTAFGTI